MKPRGSAVPRIQTHVDHWTLVPAPWLLVTWVDLLIILGVEAVISTNVWNGWPAMQVLSLRWIHYTLVGLELAYWTARRRLMSEGMYVHWELTHTESVFYGLFTFVGLANCVFLVVQVAHNHNYERLGVAVPLLLIDCARIVAVLYKRLTVQAAWARRTAQAPVTEWGAIPLGRSS